MAHAAIHAGFISPRPPATSGAPAWPFVLDSSWATSTLGIDQSLTRILGTALVVLVLGAFGLSAIGALGVLPAGIWATATAVGAFGSLALLLTFFHPWLVLGLAIDVVLLWAVLIARWLPEGLAS